MSDPHDGVAVVAYAGREGLLEPSGRLRLERVDSGAVADYAPYTDCVVLEEPGGGLRALASLAESAVPTVLYDRTDDPAVATEAVRLGVSEYVTERTLGERTLTDLILEVVRDHTAAREPPSTAVVERGDRSLPAGDGGRLERILESGRACFGLDVGAVAVTDGTAYDVVAGDEALVGTSLSLSETICRATVRTDSPLELPDTSWGPPAEGLAEPFARLGSYIGDDIPLGGGQRGTVWFGSDRPREAFSPDERAFFRLLVRLLRTAGERDDVFDATLAGRTFRRRETLASDGSGDVRTDDLFSTPPAVAGSPAAKPDGVGGCTRTLLSSLSTTVETVDPEPTASRANERFRHLFDRFPDAVADVEFRDGVAIVRGINDAFETVFGYDEPAAVGTPLGDLIAPEGGDTDELDEHAIRHGYGTAEVERETVDGRRTFLFRGFSYPHDGRQRGFGVYTDVTEQLEQQRRLRVLHRVLRHNLRNEMTVILGYADMLAEEGPTSEYRSLAERIHEEAIEVSKMGEQVRRIEQALDVDRQQVALDPEPLVRSIAERFRTSHPEATIRVSVTESVEVIADELLETAVSNLLENAIEHHPAEPTVDVELAPHDGESVDITVRDDGPGIPKREREIVGGDREITQLEHSRGLGLWVSQWVARGVDGQLLFGDREAGAEVTLRLRRADGRTSE